MSTIVTTIAVAILVVAGLAILAALAVAIGALVPFFGKGAAQSKRPVTLTNAADMWSQADERLRSPEAEWDGATPVMFALAQLATRDLESGLARFAPEAS
jgi:hypothetical protein